ncbi:helix-turn-helix domain-containing protein [Aliikangiella sp. IMCC44359]|uniref:helix-turn-helix domain-containing protein n=1 Tax=Aliikangiella sp. IMCC44359 TaxID=3459125 RepID=UPI00403AC867
MRYSRNSTHYAALRKWLISCRKEAGLSIRDLAEKLEISHSIVGKIEDGTRKIEIFEFVDYCSALDVDPHKGLEVVMNSLKKKRY